MAHFLCHLGCSHFGALLLDFYFTENNIVITKPAPHYKRERVFVWKRAFVLVIIWSLFLLKVSLFYLNLLALAFANPRFNAGLRHLL